MEIKEGHKKLDNVKYEDFKIQPYLTSKLFNQKERQMLYLIRSQCHNSNYNLKKCIEMISNAVLGVMQLKTKFIYSHNA